MGRKLTLTLILALTLACGGGWLGLGLIASPFLAPGAADVQVTDIAPGERLIVYRMPNPDAAWYTTIARRLANSGWRLPDSRNQWGDTENYVTRYTRNTSIWLLKLHERAELLGDRSNAHIRVTYRLTWR
ncbi:MAG: hypothetical protein H7Y32_17775 [Chloroflexales bacterium]|nr:hypothetical protein [Chloroflexales bacterium]